MKSMSSAAVLWELWNVLGGVLAAQLGYIMPVAVPAQFSLGHSRAPSMVPGLLETAEGTMVTPAQLAAGRSQTRESVQLAVSTKFDTNAKSVAFKKKEKHK